MKKKTLLVSVFLTGFILVNGCNNADHSKMNVSNESKSVFDLAAVKKEILESNQKFMGLMAQGDSVGIANLYSADAKFMGGGAPAVSGRANIQAAMSGVIKSGINKLNFTVNDVYGSDAIVVEEGVVTLYANEKIVEEDKYIVLWKKESGKWKMFRDIFNPNSPAPVTK